MEFVGGARASCWCTSGNDVQALASVADGCDACISLKALQVTGSCQGSSLSSSGWNCSVPFSVISRGAGLPDDTITVNLEGHTGQSFAFTLAKGITVNVQGDANDGCGKGLSGGMICVTPGPEVIEGGLVPEEHVVLGNCALYGATSGRAFFRGKAGERFCVRNSGAITVVEGIGDHGCEYMTGGRVVCLGPTGINFGAGMSGGVAYIWDPDESFAINCNMGMVEMERVESDAEADTLRSYLQEHTDKTGSTVAAELLSSWPAPLGQFVKVMPTDYKRVLEQQAAEADADAAIG